MKEMAVAETKAVETKAAETKAVAEMAPATSPKMVLSPTRVQDFLRDQTVFTELILPRLTR